MQNLSFAISESLCDKRDNLSAARAAKKRGVVKGFTRKPLKEPCRREGYGFAGDKQIAEERNALEEEIKRAKEAAERRRERYIREKVAHMPETKPGDMLRWAAGNMPEANQNTFFVNPRFANTVYPERTTGFYDSNIPQKSYYTKDKSIYGENTDKGIDTISNILTATSLVPGIDTFADAAAIPIDFLRGDYISAGLDTFGIVPFVGEVADTAKLARAGIKVADKAHDAGKVIDAVKTADKADDVVDTIKAAGDVYSGVSKREKLLSQASNQKLKNAINELYRPGAVTGDGGTADAIRAELRTGALTGGKPHIKKGRERLKNLQNILKREELTLNEKIMIQELIDDLEKALRGE